MRQVVLDTETTGLSPQQGHRLTEIGCVEIINRKITGRTFQSYLNPERELDKAAAEITGLSFDKLRNEPKFIEVADSFVEFIQDAELIIHNASFDLGFLDHELRMIKHPVGSISKGFEIIDTLVMARSMHPGQKNNLDALCKRYGVDNAARNYHGALLDSEILAQIYLAMTVGQVALDLSDTRSNNVERKTTKQEQDTCSKLSAADTKIIYANEQELEEHNNFMQKVIKT